MGIMARWMAEMGLSTSLAPWVQIRRITTKAPTFSPAFRSRIQQIIGLLRTGTALPGATPRCQIRKATARLLLPLSRARRRGA